MTASAATAPHVGVVMLTWNGLDYTRRCLASLLATTTYPDFEVVVVDNGSTDGTVEWLRKCEGITVVENGRNLGFTAGVNMGLGRLPRASDAVLVNNDLVVTQPDWLDRLVRCAYEGERTGIVGCRQVDGDGRLLHAGSYLCPVGMHGEQIGGGEPDVCQYVRRREVEAVVGAVMYLRRDMLDSVGGGLHPGYFSYFEDTDLCFEARERGYATVYCGDVTLTHFQNVSTRVNRSDLWDMFEQSRDVFRRRWQARVDARFDVRVELRATWEPGGVAECLAIALHEAGTAVVARAPEGGPPESDHPLVRDMGLRDVDAGDALLIVGDTPAPLGRGRVVRFPTRAGSHAPGEEVWVPTSDAAEAVRATAHIVPFGVDADHFHPGIRRLRRDPSQFRFVLARRWDAETAHVVREFAATFSRDEPVLLHVEAGPGAATAAAAGLDGLGLGPAAGRVVVTAGARLDASGRPALYKSADALVVVPDAFDPRPMMEAAALGVPVVEAGGDDLGARMRTAVEDRGRSAVTAKPAPSWADTAARVRELLSS